MSDQPNAIERNARQAYISLKKKYLEQQKMIKELTNSEKFEIKDQFKGMGGGRPRKYTPLRMKNKIIEYFAKMKATNRPPTRSGLMVHLKMHRDQFYQYGTYPEFKEIMEQTATMIENWYEEALILNKYSASGLQFALKNRFGWKDTQTIETIEAVNEDTLIRKIEALAPDLAGFFQRAKEVELIEDKKVNTTIEAEFTDEDFYNRGNE